MTECWHTPDVCEAMNRAYDQYKQSKSEVYHFVVLRSLLDSIDEKGNLLDVGCATALTSEVCQGFKYFGCDLPHMIGGCSMIKHPEYLYRKCDLLNDDVAWFKDYPVVVLNAVIDVMQNPLEILQKVLSAASQYVIIHRQEISETKPTQATINQSYNAQTYHSIIARTDFLKTIDTCNFSIAKELNCDFGNWENGGNSFLLRKRKSWSLNDIDYKLNKLFEGKENGFFIEAGANDGVRQSNTYYLEHYKNWKGILIEPLPEQAKLCRENRSQDTVVEECALVSSDYSESKIEILYTPSCYGLMSIIDGENATAHIRKANEKQVVLLDAPTRTLNNILEQYQPEEIDLLVLDVEGYEWEALKGIDFDKWKIEYLLIEELESYDVTIKNYLEKWYERVDKFSEHDYLYKRK